MQKYAAATRALGKPRHFVIRNGEEMLCRVGCGACCIALSISSPIPGMPGGKPAGVRCIQLSDDNRCKLFGKPERPAVCQQLQPSEEMCGHSAHEAMIYLTRLERATSPSTPSSGKTDYSLSQRCSRPQTPPSAADGMEQEQHWQR